MYIYIRAPRACGVCVCVYYNIYMYIVLCTCTSYKHILILKMLEFTKLQVKSIYLPALYGAVKTGHGVSISGGWSSPASRRGSER